MSKVRTGTEDALRTLLHDEMTIAVGGFGLSGIPVDLIEAIRDSAITGLTVVSNNMGIDGQGLGLLLESGQVRKVIASYVGENRKFAEQYLHGSLDVEFVPQGTLAERLRAGGSGIPAFYTSTGVGTPIADGKVHAIFDGKQYLQELAIHADLSLVRAHRADPEGNLTYRYTARNFNPVVAMAGRVTIVEAEILVALGDIEPDHVITPGIYVDRVVRASNRVKPIEQRTVRVQLPADSHDPPAMSGIQVHR